MILTKVWVLKYFLFQIMDWQRDLLQSLSKNQIDRVNLLRNLRKLKVSFDEESEYVILKYKLKLKLIENIADNVYADENESINRLRKETEKLLLYHNERVLRTNYKCSLVGCLYECRRHREYLRHIQRVHSQESYIKCQYGLKCKSVFSTLQLLKDHISHSHLSRQTSDNQLSPCSMLDTRCKCSISKCGGAQFSSLKVLMLHLQNYHVKNGDIVHCIFENCSSRYDNAASLRNHFFKKHNKPQLRNLKSNNKVCDDSSIRATVDEDDDLIDIPTVSSEVVEPTMQADESHIDYAGEDLLSHESEEEQDNIDDVFMMAYCDFMNRLLNFQFIPQSSIQLISEEYLKNYLKSNESKAMILRSSLLKNIPSISESDIEKIVKEVGESDAFLHSQQRLDSGYKRLQYLKNNFKFVEPVEIVFNPNEVKKGKESKAVMHYVPVIETVMNLVQDSTFIEVTENKSLDISASDLKDVKDGLLYKNNEYFLNNPEAMALLLYSDGVEVVNPLGAGRGKHKVIQIFVTFAEIPKSQRSKIDRIQLVAVVKEKVVKKFGFQKVYQRLVEDLKQLEKGIIVHEPVQRVIKCGLLLHPADNLEGKKSFSITLGRESQP